LSFNPFRPNELLIAYADNTFRIFDIEHKRQTHWSKRHDDQAGSRLTTFRDAIRGAAYNPAEQDKVVLYGSTFLAQIDLSSNKTKTTQKRKADEPAPRNSSQKLEVALTTTFQHILGCDFLADNSMVLVERRKESLLEQLPPSFYFSSFNK
jgi:U3 small nucleolar RNA-associated protein 4